jgi:PAS domain S-box-containing protein
MRLLHDSGLSPAFAHSDAWLAAIVESSTDAIVGKTLDSVIRSWNASATRIFGYSAEEAVGSSVLMLIPPELHRQEDDIVSRLRRGERVEHFDTVRVRKDGRRIPVSLSVSPIRTGDGTVVGAAKIARDISEAQRLKAAEAALSEQLQEQAIELEQQIEQSQSLQLELEHTNVELRRALELSRVAQRDAALANRMKSQFLATISHELRTPLNAIAGYVDLMELGMRGPLTDLQRQVLARVWHNQRALMRLIDDLLDIAKLESGRFEFRSSDLRVEDVLRTLETFIGPNVELKNVELRVDVCDADIMAYADRDKVEQILLNLLSNAVKFTDCGSVRVRCRPTGPMVAIDVIDTGRGVPPEMLERIFEPFVQADQAFTRTTKGTGLGLAISRQLARGMGGDVMATSVLGQGSTFTLILPRGRGE